MAADSRPCPSSPGRRFGSGSGSGPRRPRRSRRPRSAGNRLFFLRTILASLVRRRSRLLVALLSVTVGACILSGLVTIYYDIPRQMGLQFRSYGANMVLLPAGDTNNAATTADSNPATVASAEAAAAEETDADAEAAAEAEAAAAAATDAEAPAGGEMPASPDFSTIQLPTGHTTDTNCTGCHSQDFLANAAASQAAAPAASASASTANVAGISPEQLTAALQQIPASELVGVAPYRYGNVTINETPQILAGTDFSGAQATSPFWSVEGQWPQSTGQALVGVELANTYRLEVGKRFSVSTSAADGSTAIRQLEVAGILTTGGDEEAFVFVSLADFASLLGQADYDNVELSINASGDELAAYADAIQAAQPALSAQAVKRVTASQDAVLGKLQALVYLVTTVVLLLTLICVATTMMAVVTERRREIGLRKALGAGNDEVAWTFIGEGLATALVGGILGAAAGFGFAQLVSLQVFGQTIHFNWAIAPLTVVVMLVTTVLACLLPLRSATAIDPALVLKGE